jgi:CRISPR-associated protein Csb1
MQSVSNSNVKRLLDIDVQRDLLDDSSPYAAITARRWLVPVEGRDAIFFPPTYPAPKVPRNAGPNADAEADPAAGRQHAESVYNIDHGVCIINSPQAQANQMKALFHHPRYRDLIPHLTVTHPDTGEVLTTLLDAPHRIADASIRFSQRGSELVQPALLEFAAGNALPLARLAPTSLLFGFWDSRGTGVKWSRVIRSVIRAYGVQTYTRSAVYIPRVDYQSEGLVDKILHELRSRDPDAKITTETLSAHGLAHAPSIRTLGGITASEICEHTHISLTAIRELRGPTQSDTALIRSYIYWLSLLCTAANNTARLREGCELIPDAERQPNPDAQLVMLNGQRVPIIPPTTQEDIEQIRGALEDIARKLGAFGRRENLGAFEAALAAQAILARNERKAAKRTASKSSQADDPAPSAGSQEPQA